ncbi:hypothetical protein [Pararhizobium gei]|uniref:hypothetical protein n=1 Tax=Pararhizobium gei TaxID=1395951 RepID=UPI0023DB0DBF|nr:hypothetical protein [Rhizobium gei]
MLAVSGVLLLCGASGAFAIYSARDSLLGAGDEGGTSASGLGCTTVETLKMRRNGQRWIRKYISTDSAGGTDRIRTGLRISGLLANSEKADLYHVVVLEADGPHDRAARRGLAIGAEVMFAPDPSLITGMSASFIGRYKEGKANTAGLFHGKQVELGLADIQAMMTEMNDRSDCLDPMAAAEAAAHGAAEPASDAHGETDAHGKTAGQPDHSAESEPAELETHGEAAPEEPSHDTGTGSENAAAEPGFFGKMLTMVLGDDKAEAAAEHAPETPEQEPTGH